MDPAGPPFISVIVPVFNDAERLQECLNCLRAQTWPAERLEVIVVDNASTDDVAAVLAGNPWVVALVEGRPGSYAARNRGIEVARGEILAFTDSDCLPAPDWLEMGAAHLAGSASSPAVGMVGGRIDLRFADPAHPTAVELFDLLYGFPQERFVHADRFSVTANLITRRDVMERAGPFDPTLKSGGDRDWGVRAVAAGYEIVYDERVMVGHPARRTLSELTARAVRIAGGHAEQQRRARGSSRRRLARELLWSLRPPVSAIPRVLRDRRIRGTGVRVRLIAIIFYIRYRTALERLRLLLGGTPAR